LIHFLKDFTV